MDPKVFGLFREMFAELAFLPTQYNVDFTPATMNDLVSNTASLGHEKLHSLVLQFFNALKENQERMQEETSVLKADLRERDKTISALKAELRNEFHNREYYRLCKKQADKNARRGY